MSLRGEDDRFSPLADSSLTYTDAVLGVPYEAPQRSGSKPGFLPSPERTTPRLLGGRYELDGVIGRGGMAEVYRARDIRLDRIVAVKTIRADMAGDPIFQARFRREVHSAASLNSCTARILDCSIDLRFRQQARHGAGESLTVIASPA